MLARSMVRFWIVATLTACGFTGRAANDATPSGEDAYTDGVIVVDDRPVDSPPLSVDVPPCTVTPTGSTTTASAIGNPSGGQPRAPIACDAGQVAIGIAFETTVNLLDNHADQNAVTTVHLHCGTITRDAAGAFQTTPGATKTQTSPGGANCGPYSPTMRSPDVMCPQGSVLAGLTGNRIDATLFNTMSIACVALDLGGMATGPTTMFTVSNTGSFSNNVQMSTCPPATVVVGAEGRAVCGQDMIAVQCAALACQ